MRTKKELFDACAKNWDLHVKTSDAPVIREILARSAFGTEDSVLDVACGTGVLMPFFVELGITDITAADISSEMVSVYRTKFPSAEIKELDFQVPYFSPQIFSRIIVYNAFPHFEYPEKVFANAMSALKPGGRLTIAHSMNRAALNEHHRRAGIEFEKDVLVPDAEIRAFYEKAGFASVEVDNGAYFYSSGLKPGPQ